jgi:hypothetical protein
LQEQPLALTQDLVLNHVHQIPLRLTRFCRQLPQFFLQRGKNRLGEFIDRIRSARTETDLQQFYSQFGIRRTNPEIWQHADWSNARHKKYRGLQAGLLDMSRYENL